MDVINIHDAKTNFSKLLEKLSSGEEAEVIIAKAGKPLAKLVPYSENTIPRVLGSLANEGSYFETADCWDTEPEFEESIMNNPLFPVEHDRVDCVAEDMAEYNAS